MAGEDDDDDIVVEVPRKKAGPVSDEDVRDLLAAERAKNAQLTERIATERVERNRAEAIARTSTDARFDAEGAAVEARLAGATDKAKDLKKALAEAMAEGRFEEVAEIQDQLAELRAKEQQDRQYKNWLDGEKERAAARAAPAEPVVDLASYTAAQRKWIRANPRFMDDEAFRKKTVAGHALAVAEGIEVDSPEYFEVIDEVVSRTPQGRQRQRVDRVTEEPEEEENVVKPRTRERDLGTDIPPSRGNTNPRQREDRRTIRISADQREAADITLPDHPIEGFTDPKTGIYQPGRYEKYAKQLSILKATNRI